MDDVFTLTGLEARANRVLSQPIPQETGYDKAAVRFFRATWSECSDLYRIRDGLRVLTGFDLQPLSVRIVCDKLVKNGLLRRSAGNGRDVYEVAL